MRRFLLSILLLPVFSLAATIQAGFPSQAIWVSKSCAVEGEAVVVSAVVHNGSADALRATLVFTADDTRIGAREFELPSGEGQMHSIEWKPKKGEHRLAARIEGTSAELSQRETPSIIVTILEPPHPSAAQQTISHVVQTAATLASSSAPVIVEAARAVFAQTEALRNAGVERLENYLASQTDRTSTTEASPANSKGSIAGTSTSKVGEFLPAGNLGVVSKGKAILSTIAQTAAAAALFGMKNAALFYPLLALLCFGFLYYLARRVRRRPRD